MNELKTTDIKLYPLILKIKNFNNKIFGNYSKFALIHISCRWDGAWKRNRSSQISFDSSEKQGTCICIVFLSQIL